MTRLEDLFCDACLAQMNAKFYNIMHLHMDDTLKVLTIHGLVNKLVCAKCASETKQHGGF
jgi:hypothetical protein